MVINNLDDFFKELTSDEQWFSLLRHYQDNTIRKAVEKVYAACVAEKNVDIRPMSENRKHVYNILCKLPGDKVKTDWIGKANEEIRKKEEEKKAAEWVPLTGEARLQRLKEWQAEINKVEMQSAVPVITHKQAVEEGGWLPPKGPVHPVTKPMEAYVKDRHIAYIEYAYEPKTGLEKPGVMTEKEFNYEYDELFLNKEGR